MLGTEFSKIPDTDKLLEALEKNDKKGIKAAITALQEQGKKFFNKDYSTVVDRKVSKQLLALYAQLIPAGQRISILSNRRTVCWQYRCFC